MARLNCEIILIIGFFLIFEASFFVSCETTLTEDQYQRIYEVYNLEYGREFNANKYEAFKTNLNYTASYNINQRETVKRRQSAGLVTRDSTLKVNQFGDLTNKEFVDTYTGTPESLIIDYLSGAVAATGLGAAIIAGIVIGATVGTAAVGGTGYAIYRRVKTSKNVPVAEIEATPVDEQAQPPKQHKKGVNIFNFNPATFVSITARAPPRKV
mmetsp:Transcript_24785/g.34698  ORF Transcript_24785/g.34698 Transcript_24785/m.34698 type:complete len:212 (-) Transcript_24785:158-793(-)